MENVNHCPLVKVNFKYPKVKVFVAKEKHLTNISIFYVINKCIPNKNLLVLDA